MIQIFNDEYFMKRAFNEALIAGQNGEVPVGAVIVSENMLIGRAHNQVQRLNDVTAHAEIIAITAASNFLGNKYLQNCTLYVTMEPCVMCAGALRWAQLGKLVYAVQDEKYGFMQYGKELLHPKTKVEFGIMQTECKNLIQAFFKEKRKF